MYNCFVHNWHSSTHECPSCKITITANSFDPSNIEYQLNHNCNSTRDELIDRLQVENIRLKKGMEVLNHSLGSSSDNEEKLMSLVVKLKDDHKAMKEALNKYRDQSNWSYWSNHDVGAFKEEWTMFKQNCRGPEIAEKCLSNLQYKERE